MTPTLLSTAPSRRCVDSAPRYALYWVPAREHPLWAAGNAWLGRNPEMTDGGAPPDHAVQPWRYGFHATLKAPFRLRDDCEVKDLCQQVRQLARACPDFAMPPLQVDWLDGFLALQPAASLRPDHPLWQLADRCVTELDVWRAPLTPAEHARQQHRITAAGQQPLIDTWGYAHVLSHWRFHLTLSDTDPTDGVALRQRAERHIAPALCQPLMSSGIALFGQLRPERPFVLLRRFSFG
jgi:hypothetical protein